MSVWRLRLYKEIEILGGDMSGFYPKETIMELYNYATSEAFSFLFVRLDVRTRRDAFWLRFESRLVPETSDDDKDGPGTVVNGAGHPLEKHRSKRTAVRQEGDAVQDAGKIAQTLKRNLVRPHTKPRK